MGLIQHFFYHKAMTHTVLWVCKKKVCRMCHGFTWCYQGHQ